MPQFALFLSLVRSTLHTFFAMSGSHWIRGGSFKFSVPVQSSPVQPTFTDVDVDPDADPDLLWM
jgi:hypothetical protein